MATRAGSGGEVRQGVAINVEKWTLSASYTTGGEAIASPALRTTIAAVCTVLTPGGSVVENVWDRTTGKAKALTASAEVANGTDLSAVTFEAVFIGVL